MSVLHAERYAQHQVRWADFAVFCYTFISAAVCKKSLCSRHI